MLGVAEYAEHRTSTQYTLTRRAVGTEPLPSAARGGDARRSGAPMRALMSAQRAVTAFRRPTRTPNASVLISSNSHSNSDSSSRTLTEAHLSPLKTLQSAEECGDRRASLSAGFARTRPDAAEARARAPIRSTQRSDWALLVTARAEGSTVSPMQRGLKPPANSITRVVQQQCYACVDQAILCTQMHHISPEQTCH